MLQRPCLRGAGMAPFDPDQTFIDVGAVHRDSGGLCARERFQSGATAGGGSSNGGITNSETDVLRAEIVDPIGICFDS